MCKDYRHYRHYITVDVVGVGVFLLKKCFLPLPSSTAAFACKLAIGAVHVGWKLSDKKHLHRCSVSMDIMDIQLPVGQCEVGGSNASR